jgi:hypothetical protein
VVVVLKVKKMAYQNSSEIKPIDACQYDAMTQRLKRNGEYIYNARKMEVFLGHRDNEYPKLLRQKGTSLRRFASVPYHTQQNRASGVKFDSHEALLAYIDGIMTIKASQVIRGKPTTQFKTVWFSKGIRRQ